MSNTFGKNIINRNSIIAVLAIAFTIGMTGLARASMPTVDLGTAKNFAILAGTPNITDAGNASVITGDVGLSPASGAGIGLLSSQVTGTIYSVDAFGPSGSTNDPGLLTTAKNDLTTAYTDAANRTPVTTVPTELGGHTYTAGVYNSASTTFGITAGAGPLVLNGQGNPDAVFIFEAGAASASALTVGPGSTVSLENDASACNVFWRVYGATLSTTAAFKGNILALTSITVANGANIQGRLLARNGDVTLDTDTIARPSCTAPSTPSSSGTTPGLPNTGGGSQGTSSPWSVVAPAGTILAVVSLYLVRKKRA